MSESSRRLPFTLTAVVLAVTAGFVITGPVVGEEEYPSPSTLVEGRKQEEVSISEMGARVRTSLAALEVEASTVTRLMDSSDSEHWMVADSSRPGRVCFAGAFSAEKSAVDRYASCTPVESFLENGFIYQAGSRHDFSLVVVAPRPLVTSPDRHLVSGVSVTYEEWRPQAGALAVTGEIGEASTTDLGVIILAHEGGSLEIAVSNPRQLISD